MIQATFPRERKFKSPYKLLRASMPLILTLSVFLFRIAGHPLAQNEKCLHIFLQEQTIDKNYVPGKIRNT